MKGPQGGEGWGHRGLPDPSQLMPILAGCLRGTRATRGWEWGSRVATRGWERLAGETAGPQSWKDMGEGSCRVGGSHGCIHH